MLSFLVLIVNSVALYIVPQGRVAHWADWRFWGLTREEWADQHIVIGVLFLLAIFLHTYYNWKPFVSYLKNKVRQFRLFTLDFNLALLITAVCTVGAYFTTPPFNWVLDAGVAIKTTAAVKYGEPPYGGAESSSLMDFTRRIGYDLAESSERLKEAGIHFDNERQTLKEIAKINQVSPQKVYLAMKPAIKEVSDSLGETPTRETGEPPSVQASASGAMPSGLGRKTVAEICQAYGIDPSEALKKLEAKGIDAHSNDKVKDVASKYGKSPLDLYEIMK